jgi:hypothetical protein
MTGLAWLARRKIPELLHHMIRPLDRILPAPVIQAAFWPAVWTMALLDLAYLGTPFSAYDRLPGAIRSGRSWWTWRALLVRDRTQVFQARLTGYWAGRLTTSRWRRLCRVEGPAASRHLLKSRTRPAVLVTIHFGPLEMLFGWQRSFGVPIAGMSATMEEYLPRYRSQRLALYDREGGLEGLPRIFLPSQLWEAADFLRGNRVIQVAMSGGRGRATEVSDGGLRLPVATGALRLASLVGADLIPCLIRAECGGVVTIVLDDAVPASELLDRRTHPLVCQRLFRFFSPSLRTHPGQINAWLLDRLREDDLQSSPVMSPPEGEVETG